MSQTNATEAARRAIQVLGGPVMAARRLGIKGNRYQTVQSWIANRVPADYCPLIEHETRALGSPVLCEEMRPDVMWSALRQPTPTTQEPSHAG